MSKITISELEGWKIELIMGSHPYPVLSYNDEPYSILFNRGIPIEVQVRFWKVLQEYNIFLETDYEDEECS